MDRNIKQYKILISNNSLAKTGGSENYTFALALALLKLKHDVEYFTFYKGEISDKLESCGIKFMSRKHYDLILANHYTTVDFLFDRGYIIQTCHGISPKLEQPSKRADAFVAITEEVALNLEKSGFSSSIIYNGIDCERFSPERPINKCIKTVLSLCQNQEASDLVSAICSKKQLNFLSANKNTDNYFDIEDIINQADLVVGIGRSLYDAMACGRCVISFDNRSYSPNVGDGYLNADNIFESLKHNCSGRSFKYNFDEYSLSKEFDKYNQSDGSFFRQFALDNLNIEKVAGQYLQLMPSYFIFLILLKKLLISISIKSYHFLFETKQCIRYPRYFAGKILGLLKKIK